MNQEQLYNKIIQCSNNNKKKLSTIITKLSIKKKEIKQDQKVAVQHYYQEYQKLTQLNKQSQDDNLNLKKEIAIVDIQIQELNIKNTLSTSRITIHAKELQSRKIQSHNSQSQRHQAYIIEQNQQLNSQIERLQKDIAKLEEQFTYRKDNYAKTQNKYQKLIEEKENLIVERKEKHNKNKAIIQELQNRLRDIKFQSTNLRILKQKEEEKTRRQSKTDTLKEIRGILKKHKQTYQ